MPFQQQISTHLEPCFQANLIHSQLFVIIFTLFILHQFIDFIIFINFFAIIFKYSYFHFLTLFLASSLLFIAIVINFIYYTKFIMKFIMMSCFFSLSNSNILVESHQDILKSIIQLHCQLKVHRNFLLLKEEYKLFSKVRFHQSKLVSEFLLLLYIKINLI